MRLLSSNGESLRGPCDDLPRNVVLFEAIKSHNEQNKRLWQ
ncbi:hypothetical protein GPLA_3775 [Paraglaciecola polaris LMG 21857]|uniref:Uncharacterized protein n=1 Tax=Paraglaciecola polaris LMG 21857 TaxID=1129793 RepID=K7AHD3_9ALTE|nr:hypothetical protein GPLA_3775 [Paraglaciecola polaris LMG 21857]